GRNHFSAVVQSLLLPSCPPEASLTSPNPRLSKLAIEPGHSGQVNFPPPTVYGFSMTWSTPNRAGCRCGWTSLNAIGKLPIVAYSFEVVKTYFWIWHSTCFNSHFRVIATMVISLGLQASFEPTDGIIQTYSGTQNFSVCTDSF